MKLMPRDTLKKEMLPGRVVQHVVGKTGVSRSEKMTAGFACYSEESGPMQPHQHAEEVVHVIDAKDGYVRYGQSPDKLGLWLHFWEGV